MPFLPANLVASTPSLNYDELRWVIQIRQTLEEEGEDEDIFAVCIFSVPKTLLSSKPEAYIPQQLSLGPYHCWRPEFYDMERYKIAAAKRTQKQLQSIKFQNLVDQFLNMEICIRACYHKYLDFNGETLAWMMAIDASFLLEFLHVFAIKEGTINNKFLTGSSSRMSHLFDYAGTKSAHNALLRDIFMLENQIPLFILRKVIGFQYPPEEFSNELLYSMVMGLCEEVSPFGIVEDFPSSKIEECAHLLDFLYHMIVPKMEKSPEIVVEAGINAREAMFDKAAGTCEKSGDLVKWFLGEVWKLLSKLNKGPIRFIKKVLMSKAVKFVAKLPWKIITKLPGFSLLKLPVEYFFSSCQANDKQKTVSENEGSAGSIKKIVKPPLIEEITIPSVTELAKSGVQFVPTKCDITMIKFDKKTFKFHLPTISLDVNTEVILRNLVAYETSIGTEQLVFTRYTELMNGIIDTEEDAKLLRERGIVLNRLKSDLEVANLWNGMSHSVKLTKVPFLDKVIEDVNKYYRGRWKVKMKEFMKIYVFASWQCLTLLGAIFILFLMSLEAFCSVYSCGRLARIKVPGNGTL